MADIANSTRAAFESAHLGAVLDTAVEDAEEAVVLASEHRTVLSPRSVIDTLIDIEPLQGEEPIVVWRADREVDFWQQDDAERYARHLTELARRGEFRQRRIRIYGPEAPYRVMRPDDIFHTLRQLHEPGSLLLGSWEVLDRFPTLRALIYGVTFFPRRRALIVPIPSADDLRAGHINPERLESFLRDHADYDAAHSPMRAVISLDEPFVERVASEIDGLLGGEEVKAIA
jgi:hypothetical protein